MSVRATKMAKELTTQYTRFADIIGSTSIVNGWILPASTNPTSTTSSSVRVMLKRSHKDIVNNKSRASLQTYLYDTSTGDWTGTYSTVLDSSVVASLPSPSGKYVCVIRKEETTKFFIELWNDNGTVLRTVTVDKIHGDILMENWFGDINWSPDEKYIVYVAESTAPESKPYPDILKENEKKMNETNINPTIPSATSSYGYQYDYDEGGKEDWGEKYVGIRIPRIFIIDWNKGKCLPLPGIPENICVGQPVWAPFSSNKSSSSSSISSSSSSSTTSYWLTYTGWTVGSRRLGMIYCYQRPCALYTVNVTSLLKSSSLSSAPHTVSASSAPSPVPSLPHYCLTSNETVSRSPRYSPDGQSIAYLGMKGVSLHTHNGTSVLKLFNWKRWLEDYYSITSSSSTTNTTSKSSTDNQSSNNEAVPLSSPLPVLTTLAALRSPVVAGITNSSASNNPTDAVDSYIELPAAIVTPSLTISNTQNDTIPVIGLAANTSSIGALSSFQSTIVSPTHSLSTAGSIPDLHRDNTSSLSNFVPDSPSYSEIIIDDVWNPWSTTTTTSTNEKVLPLSTSDPLWFPGLHTHSLPSNCWSIDNQTLWCTSLKGSKTVIYRVNIHENSIHEETIVNDLLIPPTVNGSFSSMLRDNITDISSSVFAVRTVTITNDSYDTSINNDGTNRKNQALLILANLACPSVPDQFGILNTDIPISSLSSSSTSVWTPNWWLSSAPLSLIQPSDWFSPNDDDPNIDNSSFNDTIKQVHNDLNHLRWTVIPLYPSSRTIHSYKGLPSVPVNETSDLPYEAVLLYSYKYIDQPPENLKDGLPVIIVPHGGPHSNLNTSFYQPYAYLASLGYVVVFVNYRGSLGYGQASIASLPGYCGTHDVEDTLQATLTILAATGNKNYPYVHQYLETPNKSIASTYEEKLFRWNNSKQLRTNPHKVMVCGGSHGGFLSSHLIGQHPSLFRAAAMRNPVTNIPAMVTTTDIPDWCWTESNGHNSWPLPQRIRVPGMYQIVKLSSSSSSLANNPNNVAIDTAYIYTDIDYPTPTAEGITNMYTQSPISYIQKVPLFPNPEQSLSNNNQTTAVLLLLGLKDRRVPASQGIEYYHILKSKYLMNYGIVSLKDRQTKRKITINSDSTSVIDSETSFPLIRMLTYPEDTHALDKPATECDSWINIALWFQEHVAKN